MSRVPLLVGGLIWQDLLLFQPAVIDAFTLAVKRNQSRYNNRRIDHHVSTMHVVEEKERARGSVQVATAAIAQLIMETKALPILGTTWTDIDTTAGPM